MYSRDASAEQSGGIVETLRGLIPFLSEFEHEEIDVVIRKTAHFVEFASLGFLSALFTYFLFDSDHRYFRYRCVITAMLCLFVASTDEMIQLFSGRGDQVKDVILDFSGAVTGILAVILGTCILKRKRIKNSSSEET